MTSSPLSHGSTFVLPLGEPLQNQDLWQAAVKAGAATLDRQDVQSSVTSAPR